MVYTDEQRAEAVDLYVEHGTAEAARLTGIDGRSIRRWAKDADVVSLDNQKKTSTARQAATIANAWSDFREQEALAAGAAANRMRREALEASAEKNAGLLRARVIAYGIFIDKAELLSGQASARIEVWAESEVDKELREAISMMEAKIRADT